MLDQLACQIWARYHRGKKKEKRKRDLNLQYLLDLCEVEIEQ